jgi:cell division protein FtsI/penicillin-binding protein 2
VQPAPTTHLNTTTRVRIWYAALVVIGGVFMIRLFYLQVIRHDYYRKAALQGQLKQYEIPPQRGLIKAHDGDTVTPLVLNETRYTLFADPTFVKEPEKAALALAPIINKDAHSLEVLLKTKNTRYVVLAKKLTKDQKDRLDTLEYKGIGTRDESYRTYPEGSLASQSLGFVNDDGAGQYGVEEFLNTKLKGTPGELKAITDAQGVPLVSNKDNIVTDPKAGDDVTLTIDIGMQRQLEDMLKAGLDRAKSKSGGALIMDPRTGAIMAMANYPTYDPSNFAAVSDIGSLSNSLVSSPLEVGSIMKSLTASTALNTGAIQLSTVFNDPGFVKVGDRTVTDVEDSRGPQTVESILTQSLNTGAVWMLQQIGGGQLGAKGRNVWHDYMTNHFQLGKPTGVEQAGESPGVIPDPGENGAGIDVTYANTAFGQALTATPLQMAAAFSSVVNGGTYYKPYLVDSFTGSDGKTVVTKPTKIKSDVINKGVSDEMVRMLQEVARINVPGAMRSGYMVGGKTGTAQIAQPSGGYYADKYNGTYLGFVGGDSPEYVIAVRVNEPAIPGNAGYVAAAPLFRDLSTMLIDNFGVTPKQ